MRVFISKNFLLTSALMTIGAVSISSLPYASHAQAQDIDEIVESAVEQTSEQLDIDSINDQIAEIQASINASSDTTETAQLEEELEDLEQQLPQRQFVYDGNDGAFMGASKPKRVFNNVGRHAKY